MFSDFDPPSFFNRYADVRIFFDRLAIQLVLIVI